jgi:excisionase family DNA binding protein
MMERHLTAHEVAEWLGFSAATVVDWFEANKIPGFKIGGRLRFRPSEVEEWLDGSRNGARPATRHLSAVDSPPEPVA